MGSLDYFIGRTNIETDSNWQMLEGDRAVLELILRSVRPAVYAEIGIWHGGSLLLASQIVPRVIGVDIEEVSSRFIVPNNAEIICGDSKDFIPKLLGRNKNDAPSVILIDGDHRYDSVYSDISLVSKYAKQEILLLCHDTANSEVRRALKTAYKNLANIVAMDLDVSNGMLINDGGGSGETWGGLALIKIVPGSGEKEFLRDRLTNMLEIVWRSSKKTKRLRRSLEEFILRYPGKEG
jgi:hypothetical protein